MHTRNNSIQFLDSDEEPCLRDHLIAVAAACLIAFVISLSTSPGIA